jgi:WD40 repeat protein
LPPIVDGRCRLQFALPLVTAIAFASARRAALRFVAGAAAIVLCAQSPAPAAEPVVLKEHTGWIAGIAFSPDGSTFATASADNTVKLWEVPSAKPEGVTTTWKCTATLKGHTDYVACVAFSSDKKTLVSGSFDHTAIIWDIPSGKPRHVLKGHKGAVLAVAFHPDGGQLATAGIDGTIRFWGPESDRESFALPGHKLWVNALAYHPQGLVVASASSDFTVTIWDRPGRKEKHTFAPKAAEVRSLSFSQNRFLAAGTRYGITKVWDGDGEEVASLKGKHGAEVWGVAFSPDGKVLATADGDWNKPSDVVLWDTKTWKARERLKHTNEVLCVAFHPKKPIVAAGAWDKTVRVWDLTELLKDK